MKLFLVVSLLVSPLCLAKRAALPTASSVNIKRYIGKWYSIAALPQFFTRNCIGQTADYGIINEKTISVLNTCLKEDDISTIKGQAVVINTASNAELQVTFDTFFTNLFRIKGEYNIIKLDEDYKYVLVGSRNRKSLWIMSRTPSMPEDEYNVYVQKALDLGFPVEELELSKY